MIRPLHATRRRAVLLASGAAVLLAVGGGTTAAFAASTASTPAPTPTTTNCAVHLRAELLGAVPHQLKADLKTLRSEPKAQRAAERKAIKAKALSGVYGDEVARVAGIVSGGKVTGGTVKSVRAALPAAVKADLKTLRATAPKSAARTTEALKIEQKALSGAYGTAVQQRAQTAHAQFQQRCAARAAK